MGLAALRRHPITLLLIRHGLDAGNRGQFRARRRTGSDSGGKQFTFQELEHSFSQGGRRHLLEQQNHQAPATALEHRLDHRSWWRLPWSCQAGGARQSYSYLRSEGNLIKKKERKKKITTSGEPRKCRSACGVVEEENTKTPKHQKETGEEGREAQRYHWSYMSSLRLRVARARQLMGADTARRVNEDVPQMRQPLVVPQHSSTRARCIGYHCFLALHPGPACWPAPALNTTNKQTKTCADSRSSTGFCHGLYWTVALASDSNVS